MSGEGTKARLRYQERCRQLEIGVTLASTNHLWTVISSKRRENTTELKLKCGRHHVTVHVPMSLWGPDFTLTGLRFVSHAPWSAQRELFRRIDRTP